MAYDLLIQGAQMVTGAGVDHLSIGIEDIEDIKADLDQALRASQE